MHDAVGPDEDVTVDCWGFHAGKPGDHYVAYADFQLGIRTMKSSVQERALDVIEKRIRDECEATGTPQLPTVEFFTCVQLTENDQSISRAIGQVFRAYFGACAVEMRPMRACEDFPTLGETHGVPYAYWNFGGSNVIGEGARPTNHAPYFYFAPVIQPTLQAGRDAMALAALTFLVKH